MRYVLELAYKGTQFSGWQSQTNAHTIQSELEEKLFLLTKERLSITGCGRTDSGVHARHYIAHVDLPESIMTFPVLKSLNGLLHEDVVVTKIYQASPDFHARFDACYRKYIYRLHLRKDPFAGFDNYHLRQTSGLHMDRLQKAAEIISNTQDFSSFAKKGSDLLNFKCNIYESRWIELPENNYEYHIAANRFVRGMVRLIVGMSIQLSMDKISSVQIVDDIKSGRQISRSYSIAAEGLSLVEIRYPQEKMDQLMLISSL